MSFMIWLKIWHKTSRWEWFIFSDKADAYGPTAVDGTIFCCQTWSECMLLYTTYRIAGNFRGRKPSQILRFYSYVRKFYPQNFRHAIRIHGISLTFCESFLHEMLPSLLIRKRFIPRNFPLYSTGFLLEGVPWDSPPPPTHILRIFNYYYLCY